MYRNFLAFTDAVAPLRSLAGMAAAALMPAPPDAPRPDTSRTDISRPDPSQNAVQRAVAALCELIARAGLSHRRPAFGIDQVEVAGRPVAVREVAVHRTPFCTLLRFEKELAAAQPRVLLVAPMSGHFATLLRGTVRTMLAEHDVYITDWHNARDVGLRHGHFDFDDFIEHLVTFLEVLGPGAHLVAVCQPCVAALAAVAIMAEDGHPAQPRSMTLMAGPIDTRINPTEVNRLATEPADRLVRGRPDRHRALALQWRLAPRLPRLHPACRFYEHEPRPARQGPARPVLPYRQWRCAAGGGDPQVLRRIPGGDGPAGRILSADGGARVPAARAAIGPAALARAAGRSAARSGAPRCSPSKASATTSAPSARRSLPRICAAVCGPI